MSESGEDARLQRFIERQRMADAEADGLRSASSGVTPGVSDARADGEDEDGAAANRKRHPELLQDCSICDGRGDNCANCQQSGKVFNLDLVLARCEDACCSRMGTTAGSSRCVGYHCPKCGGRCSMMGHDRCPNRPLVLSPQTQGASSAPSTEPCSGLCADTGDCSLECGAVSASPDREARIEEAIDAGLEEYLTSDDDIAARDLIGEIVWAAAPFLTAASPDGQEKASEAQIDAAIRAAADATGEPWWEMQGREEAEVAFRAAAPFLVSQARPGAGEVVVNRADLARIEEMAVTGFSHGYASDADHESHARIRAVLKNGEETVGPCFYRDQAGSARASSIPNTKGEN